MSGPGSKARGVALGQWTAGGDAMLDVERLLLTRMLIQANSGNGKSWLLRKLFEITAGLVQQLIIDPEGEFSTLREKHDLVIVAATGGDALAHPKTAALLALRLLETRASAVLDISELKSQERHAFVRIFLSALIEAPKSLRHPVLVALDEAQLFAPEKGQGESEASDAVIDVATRGRKRGLCLVAATQRISMFHKAVAAECKNRLIGGTSLDVDVKRAAFDLGLTPKEALPLLRGYAPGHFSAFGPAFHQLEPSEFVVGPVETSHPKVGHKQSAPPAPTKAILALLPQLADLPKEAEQQAKSMEDLRRELAQTKRELTLMKKTQPISGPSREDLKTAEASGFSRGRESGITAALRAIAGQRKSLNAALHKAITATLTEFDAVSDDLKLPPTPVVFSQPSAKPAQIIQKSVTPAPAAPVRSNGHGSADRGDLQPVQARILDALAEAEQLSAESPDRSLVAILSGYTHIQSTGFVKALGALSTAGLITYPPGGRVALTDAGREKASAPDRPTTAEDLQQRVINLIGGAASKVLQPLIEANREPMTRQDLATASGYGHMQSTGFVKVLGRLKTLGFISYPASGQVVAQPVLFLEGA